MTLEQWIKLLAAVTIDHKNETQYLACLNKLTEMTSDRGNLVNFFNSVKNISVCGGHQKLHSK